MFGLIASVGCVASAGPITVEDLTPGSPASGGPLNGGFVFAIDPQSTGTGVLDPFLREQISNDKKGPEQGINTSINNPPLDDKGGPWTHDLLVSALAPVTFNNQQYYKFTLDANQDGNGPISLTQFKIFVTPGSPFTQTSDLLNLLSTTPNFDMNGGANQYRVDISSQNGSGSGDMYFLVPVSDIGNSGNLYLFAEFGTDANKNGFGPNDGFEEWNATEGQHGTVPDSASTVMLLGASLSAIALIRRRFAKA
jgi:hypothetical protein